jgi:hypothetical protein
MNRFYDFYRSHLSAAEPRHAASMRTNPSIAHRCHDNILNYLDYFGSSQAGGAEQRINASGITFVIDGVHGSIP